MGTITDLIDARPYLISPKDMRDTSKRRGDLSKARCAVSYVARNSLGLTYPQIALHLRMDHSSVIYAVRRAERLMSDFRFHMIVTRLQGIASKQVRFVEAEKDVGEAIIKDVDEYESKRWANL